ncbi:MAG: iron ABC transporter permease [Proteobacteria bacterium]|nr:iron ABC transporter permease [Pseudomonadota bacterium]MBU1583096.1 iron ABC transporter permease [Pseudomonadota bacterium]MBU2453710.1 iron ABC transporter permease [Pseudomonadota bacterium]MBU2628837.1 iron ABC transporter permease [Pseudomonadota bacterium]
MTDKKTSLIFILTLAMVIGSVFFGRYPAPYMTSISDMLSDNLVLKVITDIRIPRIIMAFITGMVLAASGTAFQMIFRNPLVDAGFLGVSGGAAFGASLGIVVLGGSVAAIQGAAALFAVSGLAFSWVIAVKIRFGDWVLRLILSGIAVSAMFAAGTGLLKYLADPLRELPELTFWLLGGLWAITWTDTLQVTAICLPCLVILFLFRWRLNLLSMQDETIFSLVASASWERILLLLTAVIATSAVVCKAGQVGWVGLIIPHIARRFVGSDAQKALPCSLMLGGFFLLLCDTVSRTLLSGEIPLGILTSFIGAGLFLILLMNRQLQLKKG